MKKLTVLTVILIITAIVLSSCGSNGNGVSSIASSEAESSEIEVTANVQENDITGSDISVAYGQPTDMDFWYGLPINFKNKNSDYSYFAKTDRGKLYIDALMPVSENRLEITYDNFDRQLYWCNTESELYGRTDLPPIYIELTAMEKGNIIGCAVIRVKPSDNELYIWKGELLKQLEFPKVNDEYQNVTEQYVNNRIEEIKSNN